ncbi:MAG: Na+/H+ antiporter subunit D [Deltaproteobacteria bacterium HGW-Deltaproteobacteria-21]|nr:MAG: Na+/H+ antiporter subunit D [Deltaproteobacteria bacterium HGW-Deltaproteobacteria-21]
MKVELFSPILIPFLTAIFLLLAWGRIRLQRVLSVTGAAALLISSLALVFTVHGHGIQAGQVGNWPAPFGITVVADIFSALMVILTGVIGLSVVFYSLANIDREREHYGYHPLMHVLMMGVNGAFLTGDIFNMYVWFEVMLIASFVLMELGNEKAQLEGAIKYVTLNLMSSAFFLTAVGILYGVVGTLNLADLAVRFRSEVDCPMVRTVAVLFFLAFGIKAAVFPLFFWLPASYHTPPAPVSAIFAGLLTKVGVYALIRVFTLLFIQDAVLTHVLILAAAGFTMATGVLGAVSQNEFRRILSFHIVSQIGYMIMGLGLATPLGMAGSVFYIFHHVIVKTNLFLVSGVASKLGKSYDLKKLGGLYSRYPWLAALFLIPALSLAGVPPLSGFWAKLLLIKAGLEAGRYTIVGVALVVGLMTLYSMTKIWNEAFWKPGKAVASPPGPSISPASWALTVLPMAGLALTTLAIGIGAEILLNLAAGAADQLMDSSLYVQAVLGGGQ